MASMGRWCDQITRALNLALDAVVELRDKHVDPEDAARNASIERAVEECEFALRSVAQLKPSVSNVHFSVREKLVDAKVKPLWDQNQGV